MLGNRNASNLGVSDIPEGEERTGQKNIWRNNGWHFPKFLVKDKVLPDSSGEDTFSLLECVCVCVCVRARVCTHLQTHLSVCDPPLDCSLPGSSVHGIFQARILEWIDISSMLQGVFPTQGSKPHLWHWQVDSLPLSHLGSSPYQITASYFNLTNTHVGSTCGRSSSKP